MKEQPAQQPVKRLREKQLDLLPKRIFGDEQDIEELLNQTSTAGEESEKKPSKPSSSNLVHPRHNRVPYPQGHDGNQVIPEKFKK